MQKGSFMDIGFKTARGELDQESELQRQVDDIAKELEKGEGAKFLDDYNCLDIQYIFDKDKKYLGSRVLVAFGGPNIWIHTQFREVQGYWWNEKATAQYYHDSDELDELAQEYYDSIG